MPLSIRPGTGLGRYEIRAKIGEGGMGDVYLAQDTKLERTVALKILPANVAADRQRMQRFIQEAKAASGLNHPNILTIHEIEQVDATHFIATEFIDGETLRQHLSLRRMKIAEALDLSVQIASGLSAAHAAGIIHRDIKPENIMRRRDGIVKVLDFGLAKLSERTDTGAVDTEAVTKAPVQTEPGVVLGTAAYMSPEQARGLAVDARTDIFSLGVVIYEMVAGRAPFGGATRSDLIVALLERDPPPLARFTPEAPAELERLVRKTLAKDREERYQTAKDLLIDLKGLKQKLVVDAEIERSAPPELTAEGGGAKPADGREVISTAPGAAAETTSAGSRANSSAEYIISEIKRHKRSALLALAALVAVTAVVAYFAYSHYAGAGKANTIRSIAVLPFANAGGNPDAEYLSDGISESLINSLSQLPGVKVIARSSSFQYKGKEVDLQEVARALGVEAVLTGRVLQRGDNLLISAELVNARDKTQVWGAQYDRKFTDLMTVQKEIAKEISEKLRVRLTGEDQKRVTKRYTENSEAYQLYLKGRFFGQKLTEEGLKKSIEYFNRAIEIDPNYALAYSGLADSYAVLANFYVLPPKEAFARARVAAARALEIDDTLAEAHFSLAMIRIFYEWDWPGGEKGCQQAIKLNPNYGTAHFGYAEYLAAMGRFDEAIREARRAQELDPLRDDVNTDLGWIYYLARNNDEAIEQYRRAMEINPNFFRARRLLGLSFLQKNRPEEAIAEVQKAVALSGNSTEEMGYLGYAYAVAGRRGEAQKVIDELLRLSGEKYVSPFSMALIYAGLGERDQAFTWLEKAYEARSFNMAFLKVEPKFDGLRPDLRYAGLLRRVGL